jgi:hypothetical protein
VSAAPTAATHLAALEALRAVARGTGPEAPAAGLPAALEAAGAAAAGAAGIGDEAAGVTAMAATYLFAARVGGAAADPDRAARWLRGWAAAPRRTPAEARAAVVEGIRFAERLHRTLGLS